jgi:hypothetical protein
MLGLGRPSSPHLHTSSSLSPIPYILLRMELNVGVDMRDYSVTPPQSTTTIPSFGMVGVCLVVDAKMIIIPRSLESQWGDVCALSSTYPNAIPVLLSVLCISRHIHTISYYRRRSV